MCTVPYAGGCWRVFTVILSARIFCQKLEAELVAIAGNYRLLDEMDTDLKGQPAMVWLEGEKLKLPRCFEEFSIFQSNIVGFC